MESLIFYIISFFICILLIGYSQKFKKKPLKSFFILVALAIPVLISSIRYNVGSDYIAYMNGYYRYNMLTFTEFMESYSQNVEL